MIHDLVTPKVTVELKRRVLILRFNNENGVFTCNKKMENNKHSNIVYLYRYVC